jgi:hypothetical protein
MIDPLMNVLGLCGAAALLVNLTDNKKPTNAGLVLHEA